MRGSVLVVSVGGVLACRPAAPATEPAPTIASDPVTAPAPEPEPEPEPEPPPAPPRADSYARLLPPSIQIVIGADLAGLQRTKMWVDNKDAIVEQTAEVAEPLRQCNVGVETWTTMLVGMAETPGPDSETTVVAVLSAPTLGTNETLACLASRHGEGDDFEWKPAPDGFGYTGKDDAVLYPVSPDTVVVSTADIAPEVRTRLEQGGPTALEGPLLGASVRTDMNQHLWAIGIPPEETSLNAGIFLRDFSGSLDLSYGMRYFVALGVDDPAAAETMRDFFAQQMPGIAAMSGGFGVPSQAMERVEFGVMGNAVTISGSVTADELDQIQDAVKAMGL